MDIELLEQEKEQEVKRREDNLEVFRTLLVEKEEKIHSERAQDQSLEKLKFDLENLEFQLQKRTRTTMNDKAQDAVEEEKKRLEVTRFREVVIPPLEAEVAELRDKVRQEEQSGQAGQAGSDVGSASDVGSGAASCMRSSLYSFHFRRTFAQYEGNSLAQLKGIFCDSCIWLIFAVTCCACE